MRHRATHPDDMSFHDKHTVAHKLCATYEYLCHRTQTAARVNTENPLFLRTVGCMLYLVLGLACGAQAAEPEEERRSDEDPGKTVPIEPPLEPKKNAPRPFVPTEKITADSIISFPVDI